MTKPGYTHIIVPKDLHQRLKCLAEQNSLSISQLITKMVNINVNVNVNVGINTGINTTTQLNLENQTCKRTLKQLLFKKPAQSFGGAARI